MLLHRAVLTAALFSAASMNSPVVAQDAPLPPPAGVKSVPRKAVPAAPAPAQDSAAQSEQLPQLPENPIKLEEPQARPQQPLEHPAAPIVEQPMGNPAVEMTQPAQAPVVTKRPAQPKGPVYYYPVDLQSGVSSVTMPPGMHIPNSPYVEDLSVAGDHGRYTYYSYRRPWYTPGQLSANVTIVW